MALKTFNLDEESYKKYSSHCKDKGISMSKQVDKFIMQEVAKIAGVSLERDKKEVALDDKHPMHKFC